MIDMSKTYKTKGGKRVISMLIVQHNSAGNLVTFPVKGTIVVREKPWKTRYQIWTMDGNASVLGDHPDDLIEDEASIRVRRKGCAEGVVPS